MTGPVALRRLALCSGALAVLGGCVSIGNREVRADDPKTVTAIQWFKVAGNAVTVRGKPHDSPDINALTDSNGAGTDELTVRPNQWFTAHGSNATELWTLKEISHGAAVFEVRGEYVPCTGLFPRQSYWTVKVRPPNEKEIGSEAPWPYWFGPRKWKGDGW